MKRVASTELLKDGEKTAKRVHLNSLASSVVLASPVDPSNVEAYSDFKIRCEDQIFELHKFVICPRSEFLRGATKNNTFQEGREGIITVHEDPHVVGAVLEFLYTGDYLKSMQTYVGTESPELNTGHLVNVPDILPFFIDIYILADKWMVWEGKEKLAQWIFGVARSIADYYDDARHGCSFRKALQLSFGSVPAHDPFSTSFVTHLADLLPCILYEEDPAGPWTEFMENHPRFCSTYIKALHSNQKIGDDQLRLKCSSLKQHRSVLWTKSIADIIEMADRKVDPFVCDQCKHSGEVRIIQGGAFALHEWRMFNWRTSPRERRQNTTYQDIQDRLESFLATSLSTIR